MSDALAFDLTVPGGTDACVALRPLVRRVVAGNPGPITFSGTCSYVVGRGQVAVVDPGPTGRTRRGAPRRGARRDGDAIVVSHTHRDHSPGGAPPGRTGAPIVGCGPHRRPARSPRRGRRPRGSADRDHRPDRELRDGDAVDGAGWSLVAVETPGHTANHLAFALPRGADAVLGRPRDGVVDPVIAPPDGSMSDYMASLDKLRGRAEAIYWPGHGGPVRDPQRFVRALVHHRRQREAAILAGSRAGDRTIAEHRRGASTRASTRAWSARAGALGLRPSRGPRGARPRRAEGAPTLDGRLPAA